MATEGRGMDSWDPRRDDFECEKFNTYDRGPGQFLPSKIERSKSEGIQLYISGIPNEMTEEGLYNLFSQAGTCLRYKKCISKNPDAGDTYGFVTMGSVADADTALAKFNDFSIGRFRMRVRIALSEEEMKKRKEKKLEEEEFIRSLPSEQAKLKKAPVGTSSDTDSSTGSRKKVNDVAMGRKRDKQCMSNGNTVDKVSAQQYPLPGGYPYEGTQNMFEPNSRGFGLLGPSPHPIYPTQSYASHPQGIVGTSYYHGNHGRMSQMWGTTSYSRQENYMQGQGRGSPRRGRGIQHHYPNPYHGDYQYQGGYGRGFSQGPSYNQSRGNYHGGGRGNFSRRQGQGYGRGQPFINQGNIKGVRQGGFVHQGPFQVPFDCQSSRYGSMESLASMPEKAWNKPKNETLPCARCEKPGSYRCSRCKTSYCSAECQRDHWDDHKERCKDIQSLLTQMKREDEVFGEISVGEDLIQKMVSGGALQRVPVVKKDTTQGSPQSEKENGTGKQSKPQKTSPKSEKTSSPKKSANKSPTKKTSPRQQENTANHISKSPSTASTDMVPLQVQRRNADAKEPAVKKSLEVKQHVARGKCLRLSEIPIGSDTQVFVTEVMDPHNIWIQQVSEENFEALTTLMDKMKTIYNQTTVHVASPVVGDVYAVQFSLDNNWYRAQVDGLQGSDAVTVTYLDYGNTETVALTKLRQLQDSMTTLPALAVKCSLADVSPKSEGWGTAVEVLLSIIPPTLASGTTYFVKARSNQGDHYIVDMLDGNGEDVRGKLMKAGVVQVSKGSTQTTEAVSSPALTYNSLPLNEKVMVLTIDVVSPDEIWVQEGVKDKIMHGMAITDKLNEMINKEQLSSVTEALPGQMYAAYSAKDEGWYRAFVNSIREDGTVNVTYAEFGNKENVSLSQMKELDMAMKSEPINGVHLVLDGIAPLPGEVTWSDTAIATLKEFVLLTDVAQITYTAEALGRTATTTSVRMTDSQGCDIADKLVEAGVVRRVLTNSTANNAVATSNTANATAAATELKRISVMAKDLGCVADNLTPNQTVPIMITDVTSPMEFVVQLNLKDLIRPFVDFSSKMNNYMKSATIGYKPQKVGELVLGLYEGAWYRAEVISFNDKEAEVRYIDFGNSEVKEFSFMSPALESCDSLPAQSVRCCLIGLNPPKVWPQTVLQYFAVLTENPLEAEFKCIKDNVALIDINDETAMMTVSEAINLELEKQKPAAKSPVSTASEVKTDVSVPTVQDVIPKVNAAASNDSRPIMASDISAETLPCTIEEAIISSIVDFESFYIQLAKYGRKLAECQEKISVYCASASPYTPVQGELVCAKYSSDKQWYRAKVLEKLEEGQFNTQFVDYGNCEEVSTDDIRRLDPSLQSLPCQSIHCKLHNVTNEGQSLETLRDFAQLILAGKVQVEAQNIDGGVFSILLTTAEGVDINARFRANVPDHHQLSPYPEEQNTGKVKLPEITRFEPTDREFEIIISYVLNPEEFYCQLASQTNVEALQLLLQNIMMECKMDRIDTSYVPEVGDVCYALFTDESWNRAAIEKISPDNTLLVRFIDFGNTEMLTRDKVRPILREHIELPVPAFKCSFQGLRPVGTAWTKEATSLVETYYQTRLTIKILDKKEDNLYIVELSEGDVNISDRLVEAGYAKRAQAEDAESSREAEIKEQIAALQAELLAVSMEKKG